MEGKQLVVVAVVVVVVVVCGLARSFTGLLPLPLNGGASTFLPVRN